MKIKLFNIEITIVVKNISNDKEIIKLLQTKGLVEAIRYYRITKEGTILKEAMIYIVSNYGEYLDPIGNQPFEKYYHKDIPFGSKYNKP